jgi:membrane protein
LTFLAGLAASLWSSNAGMKSLFDALNLVYNEPEKRSFIWLNIISLTFTILTIVFALVAMGAMVVLPIVLNFIGLGGVTELVFKIARWPALLIVVTLALALLLSLRAEPRKAPVAVDHLGQRRRGGLLARYFDTVFLVRREFW